MRENARAREIDPLPVLAHLLQATWVATGAERAQTRAQFCVTDAGLRQAEGKIVWQAP